VKLSRLARALALVRGINFVSIDMVKEIFNPVVSHRVLMNDPSQDSGSILGEILKTVPVDLPVKVRQRARVQKS
jgi:MoxR-like ATPase